MNFLPPVFYLFRQIDPYNVEVKWFSVPQAAYYLVRIDKDGLEEKVVGERKLIFGLLPGVRFSFYICSVKENGERSAWSEWVYHTSHSIPPIPNKSYLIEPIPSYRNILVMELPDAEGTARRCGVDLWWQPSDEGWWASLEVPFGTLAVGGKRLGLNCGILDNDRGVLSGNIVMRTVLSEPIEPDLDCFKNKTHELRWEPY